MNIVIYGRNETWDFLGFFPGRGGGRANFQLAEGGIL